MLRMGKAVVVLLVAGMASGCTSGVWAAQAPRAEALSCDGGKVPVAVAASDAELLWRCGDPPCAQGEQIVWQPTGARETFGFFTDANVVKARCQVPCKANESRDWAGLCRSTAELNQEARSFEARQESKRQCGSACGSICRTCISDDDCFAKLATCFRGCGLAANWATCNR